MQSADDATRTRVARAGGDGRAAALTPAERSASAAQAGAAGHRPAALARRIVKAWPDLVAEERAEVLAVLRIIQPRRTMIATQLHVLPADGLDAISGASQPLSALTPVRPDGPTEDRQEQPEQADDCQHDDHISPTD
jgi:hypothetical protein